MAYRNYSPSNGFTVDPSGNGDFTTLASAIAASTAPMDIFVRPGTYTENISMKAGINLIGFNGDGATPTVTINGSVTINTAGRFTISNIRLQTNGAQALIISGTGAATVNLNQCWVNVVNATGITFSNSNASSFVFLNYCMGDCTTNSVKFFDQSGSGLLSFDYCSLFNFGTSNVACTISAGTFAANYSQVPYGLLITSSGATQSFYSSFGGSGAGVIALDQQATTGQPCVLAHCDFQSTNVAAINIGAGSTLTLWDTSSINCTQPTPITGTGTLKYNILTFGTAGNSAIAAGVTTTRLDNGLLYFPYGITFDNTNILKNYATTSWTPTLTGATTAGVTTYTSQNGYYTRIGNQVIIWGLLNISAATGTGAAVIGNLPFTIKNQTNYAPTGSIIISAAGWAWPAGTTMLTVNGIANTTNSQISGSGSASAGGALQMTNAAAIIEFTLSYQI